MFFPLVSLEGPTVPTFDSMATSVVVVEWESTLSCAWPAVECNTGCTTIDTFSPTESELVNYVSKTTCTGLDS
jgi:hypothetical protein